MSSTPKMTVDNPSLGTLERLPAELRNTIYELAIETEYELEANYHRPCRQRQSLHLVSKQIHQETIGFLAAVRHQPCLHVNFAVTIPEAPETPSRQRILEGIVSQVSPVHDIVQAKTIRFITGHLYVDAPLAVTCHLRLPRGSLFEVYGASKERTHYIHDELESQLRLYEKRARRRARANGLPLHFELNDPEDLTFWVMCMSVEQIPDYNGTLEGFIVPDESDSGED